MIIGASSFAGTFPELMEEVDSIELYIPKLGIYEGTKLINGCIKKINDVLSPYDISTSVHAPYFSDAPNYPRHLVVDTAKLDGVGYRLLTESIEIAEELGSETVVIHPGRAGANRKRSFYSMISGLSRLAEFAGERDVMFGLENKESTDPGNLCCSANELITAVEQIDSANLKVTFDIGHANLTCSGDPSELREFVKKVKDHVVHVHVHDNSGRLTEKYWGDYHGPPGTGNVDFSVLRELDFHGIYNLEVFSIEDVRAGKKAIYSLFC